jgi:Arc/MetJ-type ribon-helix-helix transcriptional regulator
MYGMEKTTIYLPAELKRSIEEVAAERGCSEADVIREAIASVTRRRRRPRPKLPLFRSKTSPTLAENIDKALRGFGSR